MSRVPLIERFYVKTKPGPRGCLIWTGSVNQDGYGVIRDGGHDLLAHRVAWRLTRGADPDHCVCHHCDNRRCVRGSHLFDGDNAANNADKIAKRRQAMGVKVGNSKLIDDDVRMIRGRLAQGQTYRAIALDFGVSQGAIQNIAVGRTWRHVDLEVAPT